MTNLLPTIKMGEHDVTRLIIGGNPFRGNSHFDAAMDADMHKYYESNDHKNAVKALHAAEANGINTVQARGDTYIYSMIRQHREQGGTMHFICQTASEHPDTQTNINEINELDPIGIYFHGSRADNLWKAGRIDEAQDYLKMIRDTGKLVGFASHMPEVVRYVEDNNWDIDFYMTCFYNLGKIERDSLLAGGERVEEPFDDPDRDIMCRFIRSTDKVCIAYKVLAASRKCHTPAMVRDALQYAFDNIKPTDPIDVGMFQKYTDQAAMNAGLVREILS